MYPQQAKSRTGLWVGLGCGCLTLLLVAVGFGGYWAFKKIYEGGKGLVEAMGENNALIANLKGPADGTWDEADWPRTLAGGWTLTDAQVAAPNFVPDEWQARSYRNAAGETVAVIVGKATETEHGGVSAALSSYSLGSGSTSSSNIGPRQTRKTTSGGVTEAFELWRAPAGWDYLFLSGSEALTSEAALAFLGALAEQAAGPATSTTPGASLEPPPEQEGSMTVEPEPQPPSAVSTLKTKPSAASSSQP